MNKIKRYICAIFFVLFCIILCPPPVQAEEFDLTGYENIAIYIVETNSGDVLIENIAHDRMYPGSITKVMTSLLTLDICENLEEQVIVTQDALNYVGYNSSVAGLKDGEALSVYQLLCAALLPSGNDAAITLAIFCGGKLLGEGHSAGECYEAFLSKMNEKASALGMSESHFSNADGYDDYENYSTAYDIVKLGKAAVASETITNIVKNKQIEVTTNMGEHTWRSTNVFYYENFPAYINEGAANPYYCPIVTGMKTGYTTIGQKCLLLTAQSGEMNLIGAILNVNDDDPTQIWSRTYSMIDNIVNQHTYTQLVNDENRAHTIKVTNPAFLKRNELMLYAAEDISACVDNDFLDEISTKITINSQVGEENEKGKVKLSSDIKAGDAVATLSFVSGEKVIKEVDMIATEDFAKRTVVDIALYAVLCFIILLIIMAFFKIVKKQRKKKKYARKSL